MAETLLPYALTTLQRVKDLMGITNTASDTILNREINAVTEFINQSCNRKFLMTKYISEVRSQFGKNQRYVTLKNAPVFYMTDIVSVIGGGNTFTINNANGLQNGMPIFGDNILPNTTITNVSGTTITISTNFIATSTTNHIIITGLLNLMYRAGTPDNPQWQLFTTAQYELVNDAASGMVRVLGAVSSIYNNTIKADYYAGYLINFANAGDNLTHTLPSEISRLCENVVIRWYKRREQAGKTQQSLENSTISYDRLMDSQDIDIINRYRRVPSVM
jgi:hypothetical protein